MSKITKNFSFSYQLKHKVVRDLKIITECVGSLAVEAVGVLNTWASSLDINDRFCVDIEFVRWNGVDIKPVLEVVGAMEEIQEEALRVFANQFEKEAA